MLRLFILAALGIGLSFVAWEATRSTSAGSTTYGDANCDGSVNSIDAAVILQHSAGLLPNLGCPGFADVSADGTVNSLDAALVLQFVAGLIPDLTPDPTATPTTQGTPPLCPDGYYWNPAKGHCDSRECPPGFVFDDTTLYCVPAPTATPTGSGPAPTATPQPLGTPTVHEPFYYEPTRGWSDTGVDVSAGQRIDVATTGSVIYDNSHLGGVGPDGDGPATGWGNCPDHSLVGYAGPSRPDADAPTTLSPVICLGADFSGTVAMAGNFYVAINDIGGFDNNVGSWNVTVTTY